MIPSSVHKSVMKQDVPFAALLILPSFNRPTSFFHKSNLSKHSCVPNIDEQEVALRV